MINKARTDNQIRWRCAGAEESNGLDDVRPLAADPFAIRSAWYAGTVIWRLLSVPIPVLEFWIAAVARCVRRICGFE
jgi:hypothetical protein